MGNQGEHCRHPSPPRGPRVWWSPSPLRQVGSGLHTHGAAWCMLVLRPFGAPSNAVLDLQYQRPFEPAPAAHSWVPSARSACHVAAPPAQALVISPAPAAAHASARTDGPIQTSGPWAGHQRAAAQPRGSARQCNGLAYTQGADGKARRRRDCLFPVPNFTTRCFPLGNLWRAPHCVVRVRGLLHTPLGMLWVESPRPSFPFHNYSESPGPCPHTPRPFPFVQLPRPFALSTVH